MKHEQPDHFTETEPQNTKGNTREDLIKRMLQDIGCLPGNLGPFVKGDSDDKS